MKEYIMPWDRLDDERDDCDICKHCDKCPMAEPCYDCTDENNNFELAFTELIRCKDCRHWRLDGVMVCNRFMDASLKPSDYCSYAERKINK